MANTETRDYRETLDVLLALRRTKDNVGEGAKCFRQIVRDEPVDLEILKVRCQSVPGHWRIHRTVNKRSVEKATKLLMKRLIDDPRDAEALETVWKTCLLQKESKAERKFLLDIDDPSALIHVTEALGHMGVDHEDPVSTPSGGYHLVTEVFDTRFIKKWDDVTVQRDGYVFLEEFTV